MVQKKLKLTIEMVPASSWSNNLRGLLKPKMWEEIRKKVYKKSGDKCTICGRSGKLHAHEAWEYDNNSRVQKLADIIALCFLCHGVKHMGFSSRGGQESSEKFIKHFMKVNNCDRSTYQKHLSEETEKFKERSQYEWQLDLEELRKFE